MTARRPRPLAVLGAMVLPGVLGSGAPGVDRIMAGAPPGVTVEEAQEGFAAHRAGLKAGDVLLRWERAASPPANPEPAAGEVASPFDLENAEREQAPRGELRLFGTRDGVPVSVRVPPGEWRLTVRPRLDEAHLATYAQASARLAKGDDDGALSAWRTIALALGDDHRTACWIFLKTARVAAAKRKWETADGALIEARREAEASSDGWALALVHTTIGRGRQDRSEWDRAVAAYDEALRAFRAMAPASLGEAAVLGSLGRMAWSRGDLPAAEDYHMRALAIREKLAPESLDVATSVLDLGVVAWSRGDLPAAEKHHTRALGIRERLAPDSLDVASSLNNLGLVADSRGDEVASEEYHRRALAIKERLAPDSLEVAASLNNLGVVAWSRGDLATSEGYHRRALAIREKLAPGGLGVANSLGNLGVVASARGDLAAAEDYQRRALAIREKLAPESLATALALNNLGDVAQAQGDLVAAERYLRRSLAIKDKVAPDSLDVAMTLHGLGEVTLKRGDLATAQDHLQRALTIAERLAPRGMTATEATRSLGDVALASGDLVTAEAQFRRSLDIRRELAPGSAYEAEACRRLATIERRKKQPERALELYRSALLALDTQRRTLGGTDEVKVRFGARYAGYYRETIDLLVELGRAEEAFQVLERYRARGFLALMAERDLVFSADVPAELDRERRMANADYDRAFARLAEPRGDAAAKREALSRIRQRQGLIQDQIRAASPRLAALQYPEPLDVAAVRAALDPGTLLLSYSIGDEKSYVFALGPAPGDFAVAELATNAKTLGEQVAAFRKLLEQGGRLSLWSLRLTARQLGKTLLGPVASRIARAERLLIVPDGPLHLIPFAALADPAASARFRYLVEARPVSVAASATVFAELKKGRRAGRATRLVAFGDPDYSQALLFRELPGSREEVLDLERLYPGSSRTYLGADATEETAKTVGKDASLVHFACHGLADEASPLDSFIALALPHAGKGGHDNGLLQAWEVFEQVRIDADLVALSACSTAIGKEMSGEGMLGLTRAFQYAGARSVLASLWEVDDASTALLMKRFYAGLKRGQGKAPALRQAQMAAIQGASSVHPGHWAAFELIGDWQ